MQTIHLTKAVRKSAGIHMSDLIKVTDLPKYGIGDDEVKKLIKYDIMPQVYIAGNGVCYTHKNQLLVLLNSFIKSALELYEAVDARDELVKFCTENAISMADVQRLEAEAREAGITDTEGLDAYIKEHAPKLSAPAVEAQEA